MAIDTNPQTFTDTELVNLTRKAIADILAYGQAMGSNGRQLSRADLPQLRETLTWLEERQNVDSNGGGIALVNYGQP